MYYRIGLPEGQDVSVMEVENHYFCSKLVFFVDEQMGFNLRNRYILRLGESNAIIHHMISVTNTDIT